MIAGLHDVGDEPAWVDLAELVGSDDDLIRRTKTGFVPAGDHPHGPISRRRRDGGLVSMAGERLRLPEWTEISAVCTDSGVDEA
jgi:hypothetical protein